MYSKLEASNGKSPERRIIVAPGVFATVRAAASCGSKTKK
jgi:hypothetical protein